MKPQKQNWQPTAGVFNRKMRNACRLKIFGTQYATRNTQFAIRNSQLTIGAVFIMLGLLLTFHLTPSLAAPPAQAPDAPPSISGGRALWTENCAPCHGPTGRGDGPTAQAIEAEMPNLADPQAARQLSPAQAFDVIKNGRMENMMPPWGNRLSDAQIWDLTAYVWSLGTPSANLEAGEAIYLERCAACHGPDGAGNGPDAPAEIPDFTNLQAMTRRSQAQLQAGYAAGSAHVDLPALPDEELWQALDYVRTFSVAVPQRNGVLTGQVVNATQNQPVGNVQVTLRAFENNTEIETATTQADAEGNFSFANLPTDHTTFYVVETNYQGVSFSSEPGLFVPNSNETTLNLNVYETTTSDQAVSLTRINYLLSFAPNALNVIQLFMVSNSGDRAYVGENGQTFTFSLPQGATNVAFQNDIEGRFVQTENGYADTQPIVPGEEGLLVVAIYDIPYNGDTLTVDVPIPDDVGSTNLLVQNSGATLNSQQLEFVDTRQVEGSEFSIYSGGSLSAGDTLRLELTGLNNIEFAGPPSSEQPGAIAAPPGAIDQTILRWIIIGLGGVVIVAAVVVYPQIRPRVAHPADEEEDPAASRQKLLLTLARLDDAFEAGQLDEQVYRRARARYKAQLAQVMEVNN